MHAFRHVSHILLMVKTLGEALAALPFANSGLVTNATNLTTDYVDVIYLEPEAPTRARWAWADGHMTAFKDHRYIFEGSVPGVYSNTSRVPPSGIRSAPPLGGLASGTVELRADGTFRSWTIENASPAGSTKTGWLDSAAVGMRVGREARLLRTHPPVGLPGVHALRFSGASPFSRLTPIDSIAPSDLRLQLYGRSRWRVGDMAASALPAIALTLTAANPGASPLDLALFFSLPLQLQTGMLRPSARAEDIGQEGADELAVESVAPSASACAATCAANDTCASWSFENASSLCVRTSNFSSVPPAANSKTREFEAAGDSPDGSGVRGKWEAGRAPGCLTLRRPGTHAAAGEATLCAAAETTASSGRPRVRGDAAHVSFGTAASLSELWAPFAASGALGGAKADGLLGGVAARLSIPPGANASITISLGWSFPHRDFMGTTIGNRYASLYADAESAATELLEASNSAVADVEEWGAFASSLIGTSSSLPVWLGDSLLNSLHHARSTFWLPDGRFRQWESFSCVNVDSVHNDGERHLPYLLLWPGILPSKLRGWAQGALPDGMIQEQLACGCMGPVPSQMEAPCGRVMGDVSSMFVVFLLEFWRWGPVAESAKLLLELWPTARGAAGWQMARARRTSLGLPDFLVDTYDGLQMQKYNASSFSAFFHLLAMRAAGELARLPLINDTAFAHDCDEALAVGRAAITTHLWNDQGGFYRAYTGANAVMSDSLYAQVLADSLGLGALDSEAHAEERVRSHLRVVLKENDTPYGLLAMTGRYPYPGPNPRQWGNGADNSVWMMGNSNWATLSLWRGGDVEEALAVANQTLGWWRSGLNDMWNIVALHGGLGYGEEGQPLANSHYGYHMVTWHMLYALSGQYYSAPDDALQFAPCLQPPYELPVLVPATAATLACTAKRCTLRVVAGLPLRLAKLSVASRSSSSSPPPGVLPLTLSKGEAIEWAA